MGSVWDIPGIPGLWDGKDSGIERWTVHGICLGYSRYPGTLGWDIDSAWRISVL